MLEAERVEHAQQMLAVCNACRYCEQFCPVFPAIERRTAFAEVDLHYLANLCHNCGECLYACQYAPPHEFGINVPRTLAEIRLASYEDYAWPRSLWVNRLTFRHKTPGRTARSAALLVGSTPADFANVQRLASTASRSRQTRAVTRH